MSEKPRYEADELLAVAKMEGCPVIIVEGKWWYFNSMKTYFH